MRIKATKRTPALRELFIEELADVRGGSGATGVQRDPCCTTEACCEEGPFDGCCTILDLGDIVRP